MTYVPPYRQRPTAFADASISVDRTDTSVAEPTYYHDSDQCREGNTIDADLRINGTGGLPVCPDCAVLSTDVFSATSRAARRSTCAYESDIVPGTNETWRSRVPSGPDSATELLGRFVGTFRGDNNWQVQLSVQIDPTFASVQKAILKRSAAFMTAEFFGGRVWTCAELKGPYTKPEPNVGTFQNYLYHNLRVQHPLRTLYITRFWYDDTDVMGIGRISDLYSPPKDRNLPVDVSAYGQRGYFWINLNTAKIKAEDAFYYGHPRVWAGVIAHEMFHNLGLHHPRGAELRDDFMYAFGDCMESW